MSRATHHADSDETDVIRAKRTLTRILSNCTSKEEALSSSALADRVGLKATTVRDLVPEIRSERNLPIVACSKGYYIIQSPEQLSRELDRIQDEIETREDTKQELTKAFNQHTHE